jgi:hypothetical protein
MSPTHPPNPQHQAIVVAEVAVEVVHVPAPVQDVHVPALVVVANLH